MSDAPKWKFTTRDEIEEVRHALKIYFPNKSSDRAAFNAICDMAVKSLKAPTTLPASPPPGDHSALVRQLRNRAAIETQDASCAAKEGHIHYCHNVMLAAALVLESHAPLDGNEDLKLALLARDQFEGDPEGALTEMEYRVRRAIENSASPATNYSESKEKP